MASIRRKLSWFQRTQAPPSARLVAKNLGTDLQTPSRVGPRTFYASTQTPPNALCSGEFRVQPQEMGKSQQPRPGCRPQEAKKRQISGLGEIGPLRRRAIA
jgi:hypothetical protein